MATVCRVTWDVAVIGAGYVGLPLAVRFAADRHEGRVRRSRPGARSRRSWRAASYVGDVPDDELGPLVRDELLSATTDFDVVARRRRGDHLRADAAHAEPRARHVVHPLGRREHRHAPAARAGRRARVDHVPRHDQRPAARRSWRRRAWSPATTSTSPCRPSASTRAAPTSPSATRRRSSAASRRPAPRRRWRSTGPAATSWCRCRRPTPPSSRSCSRTSSARSTSRSSTRWRSCATAWGSTSGRSSRPPRTKPFGFMKFLPGPGLGGHCLPLDPFYLAWRAREFDYYTEFIELAGKVNENMPYFCMAKIARALNGVERSVRGSRVLVLGLAYKANIDDVRESPAEKIIALLEADGAIVSYHDPHVPEHGGMHSVPLDDETLTDCDCVVIVTAHRAGRLRPRGRAGAARRRPPQRDRRPGSDGRPCPQALITSASASSGSATGARTWRGTSPASPAAISPGAATWTRSNRSRFAPQFPGAAVHRPARRPADRRHARRGRGRHRLVHAPSDRLAGACRPASTCSSRSRWR